MREEGDRFRSEGTSPEEGWEHKKDGEPQTAFSRQAGKAAEAGDWMDEARLPEAWEGSRAWSMAGQAPVYAEGSGDTLSVYHWPQYGEGSQRGWGQDSHSAITKTGPEK